MQFQTSIQGPTRVSAISVQMEIPREIVSNSLVLYDLYGSLTIQFLYESMRPAFPTITSVDQLVEVLNELKACIAVGTGAPHLFSHDFNDRFDDSMSIVFDLACYLALPDPVLDCIARKCIAAYMLTDKWHSRYFSTELNRRMEQQWSTALEELSDHLQWCLNTHLMMPHYVTDMYLAGMNISRHIPRDNNGVTLWDYINPTMPTYNGAMVVDVVLRLANYKRKINVELFLKYIPKVHEKKTKHTDTTHYSACACYMCSGLYWDEMYDNYVDDDQEQQVHEAMSNRWSAMEFDELHKNAYADDDPQVQSARRYLKMREEYGIPVRHAEWTEYWEMQYDYYETFDVEW